MKDYHFWNPDTDVSSLAGIRNIGPVTVDHAEGVYVYNKEGKKYINAGGSLWNVAVGHGRTELADAAREQMIRLAYSSGYEQTHAPAMELSQRLCDLTGGFYDMVFFGSNGADAVETAVKIARQYFRQHENPSMRGKYRILSFRGGFHGRSYLGISLSGDEWSRENYGPLLPGFEPIDPPDAYHGAYGAEDVETCCRRCLDHIRDILERDQEGQSEYLSSEESSNGNSQNASCRDNQIDGKDSQRFRIPGEKKEQKPDRSSGTIAAFVAEPIMGVCGVIPIPDSFFEELIALCHSYGVLVILDEVTTGFGRTGRMFVSDAWRTRPDILCLSKGLISGYLPLSAALVTAEIYRNFAGKDRRFRHGYTASGHPVCCAVALRNIQIIEDEQLCGNAARIGAYLLSELTRLKEKYPNVGDVRGRGLMIAIELVRDPVTREPFEEEETFQVMMDCAMMGMLMYYNRNILALYPPLILEQETAEEMIRILDKALDLSPAGRRRRKLRTLKTFSENMIRKQESE